jgi:hypothetical protein
VEPRFIDVVVERSEELDEECYLRFKAVGPLREARRVRYTSDEGVAGEWRVSGRDESGAEIPARAVAVEDSGAGAVTLVFGGAFGLRLSLIGGEARAAATYLLLEAGAILE